MLDSEAEQVAASMARQLRRHAGDAAVSAESVREARDLLGRIARGDSTETCMNDLSALIEREERRCAQFPSLPPNYLEGTRARDNFYPLHGAQ